MRWRWATVIWLATCLPTLADDGPNILWITSEDNAAHWLGCYGNQQAMTPRLDALARQGLVFEHAYANAAVCAVARCTLLHGVHAVTLGTQHMRSRYPIPPQFRPYVSYLREAGYYCTNNAKTDYNIRGNDRAIWDECSQQAHYAHRPPGAPFFAVFNLELSHESSLFPAKVRQRRKAGILPATPRLAPSEVMVPPYLPDLPEVRSDLAIYHDLLTALDRQVGRILDQLAADGLADDTIVFYYSDHGGPTPRGKRYLTDTGVRIPLLIRVPHKWRRLSRFLPGTRVSETVSFVDFAPTLLSLCGISIPPQMQGRAFLGEQRVEPATDAVVFLYADRFDEYYGMRRGITDGRFKYIRRFSPHLPAAPYSDYQYGMPSWQAWRRAWRRGLLADRHRQIWEAPQVVEQLYDTHTDPWELHNLAQQPESVDRAGPLRQRLRELMHDFQDAGVIPEPMYAELAPQQSMWALLHGGTLDLPAHLELAFLASSGSREHLPQLLEALESEDPVARYWGATGCLILSDHAVAAAERLEQRLQDPQLTVRVIAAHALFAMGRRDVGKSAVLAELEKPLQAPAVWMVLDTLRHMDAIQDIPPEWAAAILADEKASDYTRRVARRVLAHQER